MRERRLALLALAFLLFACQPAAITPSATASPGESTSVVPAASAPPALRDVRFDQYRWQEASISIEPHTLLLSLTGTSFGWVAVGVTVDWEGAAASLAPDEDPFERLYSGVVWNSPDGRTWTRHVDGPEFDGARMTKVVGHGSGALAFGLGGVCLPDACGGLPPNGGTIVWSSSDGGTWERHGDTGLADGATMDVTHADGGLVAVGYVANDGSKPDTDAFSGPTDAAVWRSVDGRHWAAVTDLPEADRLSRVSAQGASIVALGTSGTTVVAWTSDDAGRTWKGGPSITDDCCPSAAIADGRAVVASSDGTAERPDGLVSVFDATSGSWTQDLPHQMRGYQPAQVQVLGSSFVIFGWTVHRDSESTLVADLPIAFASSDGATWVRVALPVEWGGQAPYSVAGQGDHLAAILQPMDSADGPPDAIVQSIWLGTTDP